MTRQRGLASSQTEHEIPILFAIKKVRKRDISRTLEYVDYTQNKERTE